MSVLRPDPAEYIQIIDGHEVAPIHVLRMVTETAVAFGIEPEELREAAYQAESIRDFSRLIHEYPPRECPMNWPADVAYPGASRQGGEQ